jgi:hypothetical protein
MRLRPLLLLLAFLAGPLAGQNDDWRSYKNDAGNFSILMPIQPTESVTPGEGDASTSHTIQAITGGVGYVVVYVTLSSDQTVDEPTFRVYRDSFMHGLGNCQQESESAAAPAVPGYIGHWYRVNCRIENKPMTFSGNLYWGKRYAYAVMVIFNAAPSDPPATKKFTGSFAVLDAGK